MNQENNSEPKKIHYIIVISITILFLVFLRLRALERENMIKDKVEETIINCNYLYYFFHLSLGYNQKILFML